MSHLVFVKSFFKKPTEVGALWPSSNRLAQMICKTIPWNEVNTILEFGPGTGAITREIVRNLSPNSRFLAIERSPDMAKCLRSHFPSVEVVVDSVEHVERICQERGIESVDAIVSGLPWSAFSADLQERCLSALTQVLAPEGWFSTYAYWQGLLLPAGKRFRRRLRSTFDQVQCSRTVWGNMPPAFVYSCRRPSCKSMQTIGSRHHA